MAQTAQPIIEKKNNKCWKQIAKCKRCNKRFVVKHGLRLYCDECKKAIGK